MNYQTYRIIVTDGRTNEVDCVCKYTYNGDEKAKKKKGKKKSLSS
jgi:hypothetical protein